MNVDDSDRSKSRCTTPACFLHRSIPGEYLAMALMMHAGLGVAGWITVVWLVPEGLLLVAAGLWIVARAASTFSGRWFAPLVTIGFGLAVCALWLSDIRFPFPGLVAFSPPVFLAMLFVILAADLVELATIRCRSYF